MNHAEDEGVVDTNGGMGSTRLAYVFAFRLRTTAPSTKDPSAR